MLYSILEDESGNLWISSLKGLMCFNTATEKVKVYTRANGLLTDQFNYNSAYKHTDGTMYFGSVKGMVAFDPAAFNHQEDSPPTYITGFQINNKDVDPGERGARSAVRYYIPIRLFSIMIKTILVSNLPPLIFRRPRLPATNTG
ncbi:hypothetical protein LWM68_27420 [Niabella sp. W65]|nr:hypothetical protein [Niabella sp. W65]MCH7366173.1 hypothetical protein [Niabella sp. W65]